LTSNVLSAISKVEDSKRLNLTLNLWQKAENMAKGQLYFMYSSLAHNILAGNVAVDYNDPIIQNMFKTCENMTFDQVRDIFEEYALVKYRAAAAQEFLNFIHKRIKHIRRVVHVYFNWPLADLPPKNPEDPWIHEEGKLLK